VTSSTRYEVREGVATLTLARPEVRNALGIESARELAHCIRGAENDPAARLLLLEAEGPAFCAGMDLKSVDLSEPGQASAFAAALSDVYEGLLTLSKPVLCAVDGPVSGGGVGIPGAADLVWAGSRARFALPETRLGLVPALVSVPLRRRVSSRALRLMAIGGISLDADQAVAHALADFRTLEAGPAAHAFAGELVRDHAPDALARTKRFLGRPTDGDLPKELADARREFEEAVRSVEAQKGLAAFRHKEGVRWDT